MRLSTSAFLTSPVALGRREICLPPQALTELTPERQEAMLAHELAHLVRRDPTWLAACDLLEAVFFFQPLNRLGRRRLQATAEFLCDDWAVARTGRRMAFAECLAQVAGWIEASPESRALPAAVPGMASRDSALIQRVQRLASGVRNGVPHRGAMALLSVVVLGVVSCGVPTISASADESIIDRLMSAVSQVFSAPEQDSEAQGVMQRAAFATATRAAGDAADLVEVHFSGDIGVTMSGRGLTGLTLSGRALRVAHERGRLLLIDDEHDATVVVQGLELSGSEGDMHLMLELSEEALERAQDLGWFNAGHDDDEDWDDDYDDYDDDYEEYEDDWADWEDLWAEDDAAFEDDWVDDEEFEDELNDAFEQSDYEFESMFEQVEAEYQEQLAEWEHDFSRDTEEVEWEFEDALEQRELDFEELLYEIEWRHEELERLYVEGWEAEAAWVFLESMEPTEREQWEAVRAGMTHSEFEHCTPENCEYEPRPEPGECCDEAEAEDVLEAEIVCVDAAEESLLATR